MGLGRAGVAPETSIEGDRGPIVQVRGVGPGEMRGLSGEGR